MISQFRAFLHEYAESPLATVCLVIALGFAACALLAPLISPIDPYDLTAFDIDDARLPPGSQQVEEGAQASLSVRVTDGVFRAEETLTGETIVLSVEEQAPGQLRLRLDRGNADLAEVRLMALPRDVTVEGAERHPIRSEWTLTDPGQPVTIDTGDQTPGTLTFTAEIESASQPGERTFLLGTDGFGRDMLSAIIYGIRISFVVGAIGAIGSMAVGSFLGLIAAWFGGRVDSLIMRVADFQLSIPSLMVGLLVLTILGKGVDKILIAIILVQWTYFARTTRSVALAELRTDYVDAARCLRFSALRINLRHILPNCLPPLLVILTINIASAITLEASLSFLGVGLPLTQPSLGMLISNGYEYMFSNLYWIALYPGLVLMVMVVSINVVGDRLRDMFNPQLKK